jgi:hypothetical protein
MIGGRSAPGPLGGLGIAAMTEAKIWPNLATRILDNDIYLRAWK